MLKLILIAALIFPSFAKASDWSDADTVREAVYLAVLAIDYGQTRNIAHHPENWQEITADWAITSHPSAHQVDNYFALLAITQVTIAYLIPAEYRKKFQYINIVCEARAVHSNFSLGIGVEF